MPLAQVWPPLLPHISIEPLVVGVREPATTGVGSADVGEAVEEINNAGEEVSMNPVVAINADGLRFFSGAGRKLDTAGGP